MDRKGDMSRLYDMCLVTIRITLPTKHLSKHKNMHTILRKLLLMYVFFYFSIHTCIPKIRLILHIYFVS